MAQPDRSRPVAVTISSCLLCTAAVLTVLYAADSLWHYHVWVDAYEAAVRDGAVASESFEGFAVLLNHGFALAQIAAAGVMIATARGNWRGRRSARTRTRWLGGFLLCCPALDATGSLTSRSVPRDAIQQRLHGMLPQWWEPATLALVLLLTGSLLLALTLLSLPAASRFFRDPASRPPASEVNSVTAG